MTRTTKLCQLIGLFALSAQTLLGALNTSVSTPSMKVYEEGAVKLTAYTDVPGNATQAPMVTVKPGINPQNQIPLRLKSDIFEIRVKSAATNGQWVQCFANYTYNRGNEIEDTPQIVGFNSPVVIQNYQNLTKGWTHSFANIEITQGSQVDVEISLIGTTTLNNKNFIEKFAVHPFDKATNLRLEAGKIYFSIDKPSQVVIDINGQMDDHNAAINPMVGNSPAHAVSLFANPILAKPASGGPGIVSVAPGTPAPDPSTFNTLVFQPGVHLIGLSYPLHPGKSYYIPGDAVLIGTFSNLLSPKGTYRTKGDSIRMFGYGTISGAIYTHYLYPGFVEGPTENSDRTIVVEEGVSCEFFGLSINDPFNHSMRFFAWSGSDQPTDKSYSRWMKPITWRANGDGIGGGTDLEDCFLRTADDSTYATGNRRRCVFWKDVNAALVHMPDIPSETIIIEDCDVIYNRLRTASGTNGGGFQLRDGGKGVLTGNTIIRNIRFLDKRSNMPAISFNGVLAPPDISTSFTGVTFENIALEPAFNGVKPRILGAASAPWFGGLTFKNVTVGGVLLTNQNFDTFFTRNEWVDYIQFGDPASLTLTTQNNSAHGEIRKDLTQATYLENTPVVLTAVAKAGEFVFSHWSGDASGSSNPLTVWMTGNKTITANFRPATITEEVVITAPGSGTWTVPAGVYSATIEAWGGGGAGGSAYNGLTSGANTQARGSGGAGGSFASKSIRVSPGQVITYTVGAGGLASEAGFVHNSNAGAGSTSSASANSESTLAVGGPGGKNISVSNLNLSGVGAVAPITGNVGSVIYYGGSGATGNANGTGGGGGSAGAQGAGGAAPLPVTEAAGGIAGLGGGAEGAAGHNSTEEGKPGGSPGAGGSGAGVRSNAYTYRAGGIGGDGQMIVTYNTLSFTLTTNTIGNGNGNGSILLGSPGGSYLSGTTVGVTAVIPFGYRFTGWSGALTGSVNPTSILMDDNKSITATFELDPTVGSIWDGGGSADGFGNFDWSDAANWVAAAPVGGNLVFAGADGTTSNNNLTADSSFTGITFHNASGAFTLTGNRVSLGGNVVNESTTTQTLNLPLILSPTRTFDSAAGNLAIGGILSGTGGFIKAGPGTLTLSAANTYSGTTAIQRGTIVLSGGNNRIPPSTVVSIGVFGNATTGILQLGDSNGPVNQTLTSLISAGGDGTNNRLVGGNSNISTLTLNISNTVLNGVALGGTDTNQNNLALIKTGVGTVSMRNASTYTGPTEVHNGSIEIGGGDNRLPTNTAIILGNGTTSGVLMLGNTNTARSQTVGSLTTSGTGTANRVMSAHATSSPRLTISNSTNVVYDGILGGPIANNNRMNFTKNGAGTLTLSGTNTYFGTTSVTLGTLLITGNSSAAIGAIDVTGGTLGGTGSMGGTVTVAAAGSISPGVTIGTLTIGGSLSVSAMANGGAGKLNFQLGPIAASDRIVVNGTLTLGTGVLGFSDFNFSTLAGLQNGTYKLITNASSISGSLDPVLANRAGILGSGPAQGTLQLTGNDLELVVTGIGPGPLNKFIISGISSSQTVGTPITGITITAQDSSNNTVTSFSGTVTFGGTGGFSGASATFTAGVLSNVSVTPTVSGSNLTFTVNDGPTRTGFVTITTIQTQYQAWAGTALFNEDANNDGVQNGLAWLLGAASPAATISRPTIARNGTGLVMSFSMLNAARRGTSGIRVQHSSNLGVSDPWTDSSWVPDTAGISAEVNGVTFNVTLDSPLNKIIATISGSEAAAGKIFGRLKGVP